MPIKDLQKAVTAIGEGNTLDIGEDTYTLTAPLYIRDRKIHGDGARIIVPDKLDAPGIRTRGTVELLGEVTVVGEKPPNKGYTHAGEFRHAIVAEGVLGLVVEWSASDVWGDGLYVGKGPDPTAPKGKTVSRWSENVTTSGGSFRRVGRQGLTVVAGRNVTFENIEVEDSGRSVVDLEPPGRNWGVEGFTFRHSVAIGGHGMLVANKGSARSFCSDITIEDIDAIQRAVDVRCLGLDRRRANYRLAALRTDVRVLHSPFTFWGIDGLTIDLSAMDVPIIPPTMALFRPNDSTAVTIIPKAAAPAT